MRRRLQRAVDEWLRQEREGHGEGAEKALFEVFASLPLPSLPIGFAERVLQHVQLPVRAAAAPSWTALWSLRAALILCLVLGALFLTLLPTLLPSLLGILNPGRLTDLGVSALVEGLQRLGAGLVVWRALSNVGSIVSSALASPPYFLMLLTSALLSIGAFKVLHNFILSERSSGYVRATR